MTENDYSQTASHGGRTGGVAQSGSGPAAAGESAAADRGGAAAAGGSTATGGGLAERVQGAPWWSKLLGLLALLAGAAATGLLIAGKTDAVVAGYAVAVVALFVAAVPLFRA